jgi:hypothetical protein
MLNFVLFQKKMKRLKRRVIAGTADWSKVFLFPKYCFLLGSDDENEELDGAKKVEKDVCFNLIHTS